MTQTFHQQLDEIKAIQATGDKEFCSYLAEREAYNNLLDGYFGSLVFVDENLKPERVRISDQRSEEILGIKGETHYKTEHTGVFDKLMNSLFTPTHQIFMNFDSTDHIWKGQRGKDIDQIRTRLIGDLLLRIVELIGSCRISEVQQQEV